MLDITAVDIYGNSYVLPVPMSFCLNQDADVPADDVTIIFASLYDLPELNTMCIKDDDIIIFKGIVDEQQALSDDSNIYTKIIARSMAAVLLDNESKPINYTNPSTSVIYSKHLKPYGIDSYCGEDKVYRGNFNIAKGTTCWQALKRFCVNTYGNSPRIEADGTANFEGINSDKYIEFSNSDGIAYYSIKENNKRCQLISNVFVKAPNSIGYNTEFTNDDAISRKVQRCRYIDGFVNSMAVNVAESIIKNAKNNSYEIIVITPSKLVNVLGAKAKITDKYLGIKDNLYISSINYNLRDGTEYTTVKLKKEN